MTSPAPTEGSKPADGHVVPLKADLPPEVRAVVEAQVCKPEDLLVAMASDLLPHGDYGETWLLMSRDRIAVVTSSNGSTELVCEHDIDGVTELAVAPGVGNSLLEMVKGDERYRLLRFTNAKRTEFSEAARLMKGWATDKKWDVTSFNVKRATCPRCHRPMPPETGICPACMAKGQLLRRSLSYLKPHRAHVAGMILLMTMSSVVALVPPWLGRELIDRVITPLQNQHLLAPLALAMLVAYIGQAAMAEIGTHAELMAMEDGVYQKQAKLYSELSQIRAVGG